MKRSPDDGSEPFGWQAIIWIKGGLVYWNIYIYICHLDRLVRISTVLWILPDPRPFQWQDRPGEYRDWCHGDRTVLRRSCFCDGIYYFWSIGNSDLERPLFLSLSKLGTPSFPYSCVIVKRKHNRLIHMLTCIFLILLMENFYLSWWRH